MAYGERGGSFDRFDNAPKPVKVGEELEVKIEAIASRGDGIAKKEGFVIFVPAPVTVGETIKVKIVDLRARHAIAQKVGSAAPAESAPNVAPAETPAPAESATAAEATPTEAPAE